MNLSFLIFIIFLVEDLNLELDITNCVALLNGTVVDLNLRLVKSWTHPLKESKEISVVASDNLSCLVMGLFIVHIWDHNECDIQFKLSWLCELMEGISLEIFICYELWIGVYLIASFQTIGLDFLESKWVIN